MKFKHIIAILLVALFIVAIIYILYSETEVKEVPNVPEVTEVTEVPEVTEVTVSQPWLEMPYDTIQGTDIHKVTHWAAIGGKPQRNYSLCYDEDIFTSYWVAYPLCSAHLTTGRAESWGYDDKVPSGDQTDVRKGYGVSIPTANYSKNFYARGHQIPNADRNAVPQMQAQTYYSTNMTPQIQNGFNGGIWAKLEAGIRETVPANDTLYIVTGASFEKQGKKEDVEIITNKNDSKRLPVPNYYWKAVLKVKRSADGSVRSAQTIGFWLPHDDLKGHSFSEFSVSVDSIEFWTGINLFVNLPDRLENIVESNDSWIEFQTF